jgi:creatinine amidohydrolase
MYFRPELVSIDNLIEDGVEEQLSYSVYPAPKEIVPKSGLLATARSSSPEKGKLLAEDITNGYVKILKKEFSI